MKCISLWQPWATLWVNGIKVHETRHWRTNVRGTVLVHAAKHKDGDAREFWTDWVGNPEWMDWWDSGVWPLFDELPFGAIIGTVDITDCLSTTDVYDPHDEPGDDPRTPRDYWLGDYSPGRFAWRAKDPVLFNDPVPWKGSQGFFEVPESVVMESLRG